MSFTEYPNPEDKPPARTYADLRHSGGWVLCDPPNDDATIRTDTLVNLGDWR